MDDLGFINFDEFPDDFGTISEILNDSSSDDGFSGSINSGTPNSTPPQVNYNRLESRKYLYLFLRACTQIRKVVESEVHLSTTC